MAIVATIVAPGQPSPADVDLSAWAPRITSTVETFTTATASGAWTNMGSAVSVVAPASWLSFDVLARVSVRLVLPATDGTPFSGGASTSDIYDLARIVGNGSAGTVRGYVYGLSGHTAATSVTVDVADVFTGLVGSVSLQAQVFGAALSAAHDATAVYWSAIATRAT